MPVSRIDNIIYVSIGRETYAFDYNRRPLGAGQMGTVFLGYDVNRPRHAVAIKVMKPEIARIPSVRRRAMREGSLQYGHRHLIEMLGYAVIEPDQGVGPVYIVSEYVNGLTLEEHVDTNLSGRDDSVAKIIETMYPVLDALSYLHDKGIYHLDIKPGNIMVERGNSNIRLMDLGIANTRNDSEITGGGLLGTPGYAAPEQWAERGKPFMVDARTDLYELAMTYYRLLGGDNTQVSRDNDPRLQRLPGVKKSIMKVLERALRIDPDERFQNAREMETAMRKAVAKPVGLLEKIKNILLTGRK